MKITRWWTSLALATATTLVLAACTAGTGEDTSATPEEQVSEESESPAPEAVDHNAADTEFAQMMIIHHQGAIEMAELAIQNASTEEVRALGQRITAAQAPEIETMAGWLEEWDEAQPGAAEMGGMGHEGMDMGDMDQAGAMAELSSLTGADFDSRFLGLMIEHHRGAIEMAEAARANGQNPDVIQFAGTVIDDQMKEITEMTNLVNTL